MNNNGFPNFAKLFYKRPMAVARITGSDEYPDISGYVRFYQTEYGVFVIAQIRGLPDSKDACASPIFAFHIHGGEECQGNVSDPFAEAGTHYNPHDCPHPYHAGDMPSLFGANGMAFSAFLTGRFTLKEILGKTVIIHSNVDNFTSQPSGNSGTKIACGKIVWYVPIPQIVGG